MDLGKRRLVLVICQHGMTHGAFDETRADRVDPVSAFGGPCHSGDEAWTFTAKLKHNKKVSKATHNSSALICGDKLIENDDGEAGAGMIIFRMLEREALR